MPVLRLALRSALRRALGVRFGALRPSMALGGALVAAVSASACAGERGPEGPADLGPSQPVVEYVTKQQILTELPLRVQLPARYGAERVLVFVHLWGTHDWKTLELAREGQTWEGAVSCRAVSTVTGDTKYFFVAVDARGEPVVSSGSPEWPHVATIVRDLPDGPQGLADEAPPAQCFDPADCPSDFAGCPTYTAIRPRCTRDDDCALGTAGACQWDGYCVAPVEPSAGEGTESELLATAVKKALRRVRTAKR